MMLTMFVISGGVSEAVLGAVGQEENPSLSISLSTGLTGESCIHATEHLPTTLISLRTVHTAMSSANSTMIGGTARLLHPDRSVQVNASQ